MSDESLYRELQEQEREEDERYRQNQAPKELNKVKPKPVDFNAAMKRFEQDFKPMFARREKARTSKAYRLFLKVTGQWTDMDAVEAISPTKGLQMAGESPQEMVKRIQQDPAAFAHLAKTAPKVTPVEATRRNLEPKVGGPRDDS